MRNRIRVFGCFAALFFSVLALAFDGPIFSSQAQAQSSGQVISGIIVKGNRRLEPQTVISYMVINKGDVYDAAKVNASLKALFRTGLFSDVQIFRRRAALIVQVVENPIINRVNFEGNSEIKDSALKKEVELRARVVFTTARAQKDVERITTLYRRSGRFSAKVVPKIIKLSQNRVNLVYEITEGAVTRIERINFIGNRAFSDSKLRSVIATAETRWWKFMTRSDNYDPDRLNFDRELLRRHYLKNGFADFRVISAVAELARDGTSFFITFSVEEGAQYTFGKMDVSTDLSDLNTANLLNALRINSGEIYDASVVDKAIDRLTEEAGKTGFAFARVRPKINRNREARVIDIVFDIKEGPRVYIERIDVVGNVRTLDRVIRRELRLAEGDAYNRILVDKARRRITALDFFAKVKIEQTPGSAPDKVILTVKIQEKSTGSLSFGAGFSTSETVLGDVSITERNFLGKGQFIRLRTSLSFKRQQVDFNFTEPYFLGRKMTFGVDAFVTETNNLDESSFKSKRVGGGVRFGFPLSDDSHLNLRYALSYSDLRAGSGTTSLAIILGQGKFLTSSVGYSWIYDTRDNPRDPTMGAKLSFSQDLAGLGGDVYYLRTSARGAYYHPLYWPQLIGMVSMSAGHILGWNGKDVRILDRFFKGGQSFRGFKRSGIGPRDSVTGDALGGKVFAIGTVETSFPLGLPEAFGLRGGLFTDVGTLFDSPNTPGVVLIDKAGLRASAGASVIWKSPMGPIRFDLGYAFLKQSNDNTEVFRFSGGTTF